MELATAAHTQLLRQKGLLSDESNMLANRPLRSEHLAEGLVIDDYFSVSVEPIDRTDKPAAVQNYEKASDIRI